MGPRPKIILADDNLTNQLVVGRSLKRAGFTTETVSSGHELLDYVRTKSPADGIVVDVHMPGMNGPDAVSILRAEELAAGDGSRLPMVLISGDDSVVLRSECMDAGADAFFVHPIPSGALGSALSHLVRSRKVLRVKNVSPPRHSGAHEEIMADVGDEALLFAWKADAEIGVGFLRQAIHHNDPMAFRERLRHLKMASASIGGTSIGELCESALDFNPEFFSTTAPVILQGLELEINRFSKRLETYFARDIPC